MVADRIFQTMAKDGLPITKLCTLVRDGPNINKTIFRKLEGAIKDDTPDFNGFVDLGSCVLHNIYNAFGKGLEDYGKDIEHMCVDIQSVCAMQCTVQQDKKSTVHCKLQWVWRCTIFNSIQRWDASVWVLLCNRF